jgi:hypothetical protein
MDVAKELYANGWQAREVKEKQCKNVDLVGTQKHMIRFARTNGNQDHYERVMQRAGLQLELVFFGSHDGSTKFKMFMGFLRWACFNTQVSGDVLEEFCFMHRQQASLKMAEALKSIQAQTPNLAHQIRKLALTDMSRTEKYAFAKRALELKHGEDWHQTHQMDIWEFLKPKRPEDARDTVFNVYNRCQEKLMKGEYQYISQMKRPITNLNPEYHPGIEKQARPVQDISIELTLNQGLWKSALEFGEYLNN